MYFVPYCFKYSCCNEKLFINANILWLLQCVMDLTMLMRAFYLFIELLTVEENVLYMSFNAIECIKRIKCMVVAQILKTHLSLLKQFSYE